MTIAQINAEFARVTAAAKTDNFPHGRYGGGAAAVVVPYLIGRGITIKELTDGNVFSATEIALAIHQNKRDQAGNGTQSLWERWCKRLGSSARDIEKGNSAWIVDSMRGWCFYCGVRDWRAVCDDNGIRRPVPKVNNMAKRRTVREIVTAAAKVLRVSVDEIDSPGRHPRVVMARAIIIAACKTIIGASYPEIQRHIRKGRSHASAITTHGWFTAVWNGTHVTYGPEHAHSLRFSWGELLRELQIEHVEPTHATGVLTIKSMAIRQRRAVYVG